MKEDVRDAICDIAKSLVRYIETEEFLKKYNSSDKDVEEKIIEAQKCLKDALEILKHC